MFGLCRSFNGWVDGEVLIGSVLLVRHAKATGQEPGAELTPEGAVQAQVLADLLVPLGLTRMVSSPWRRAVETIQPLSEQLGLPVLTDDRLTERVLSPVNLPLWQEALRVSFAQPQLKLPGGESGAQARARGLAALDEARDPAGLSVVVTHGNLLALILGLDFEGWAALRNPDVWLLEPSCVPRRWQA